MLFFQLSFPKLECFIFLASSFISSTSFPRPQIFKTNLPVPKFVLTLSISLLFMRQSSTFQLTHENLNRLVQSMPRAGLWVVASKEIGCNALQIFQSLCDFYVELPLPRMFFSPCLSDPSILHVSLITTLYESLCQFSDAKLCILSYVITVLFSLKVCQMVLHFIVFLFLIFIRL